MKPDAGKRDAEAIRSAETEIRNIYDRLEKELAGRTYLCDEFSVADIGTFMTVSYAANFGVVPGTSLENLNSWFKRVGSRPSVRGELRLMAEAAGDLAS